MGLLTSLWDDEILERGETRRDGDELFRVKVVGSTPAGPTIPSSDLAMDVFTRILLLVRLTMFLRHFIDISNVQSCIF
jgi:hypothetical protein